MAIISTHMPLARHDNGFDNRVYQLGKFLLTCLLRGMTYAVTGTFSIFRNFYSHASCEA